MIHRMAAALLLYLTCSMNLLKWNAAEISEQNEQGHGVHSTTFRSPSFNLGPGEVIDDDFQVNMPQGHIALRGLDAQVVDEHGTPIPLYEIYLHHWVLRRYYIAKGSSNSSPMLVPNAGVCQVEGGLSQWYGLGSETRRTNTTVPPPYGIVVGDKRRVPSGFEEAWVLSIHAIDTRGTVDIRGCTECACELYNVSKIPPGYEGGLDCCHEQTHCTLRSGYEGRKWNLFMEYTVTWVEMTEEVVPVRVYILDVTDARTSLDEQPQCQVEYTVHKCAEGANECLHTAESVAFLPDGGDVVYAVAHQHSGGVGSSLYNENGVEICSSLPIYGEGNEAGNESGYIVGMTSCYPKPGTVRIRSGEKLRMTSLYNNEQRHTGVMGLFYLLVADSPSPRQQAKFHMNIVFGAVMIAAALTLILLTMRRYQTTKRHGAISDDEARPLTGLPTGVNLTEQANFREPI